MTRIERLSALQCINLIVVWLFRLRSQPTSIANAEMMIHWSGLLLLLNGRVTCQCDYRNNTTEHNTTEPNYGIV
ncbi:MAG: hypothetical protein KF752_00970 [Pirellulaceae bacterium]|nr:hypothetical protein [Pirellulaceae bacterium]